MATTKSARRAEMHARYDGPLPREALDYIAGHHSGALIHWPAIEAVEANVWGNLDAGDLHRQLSTSPQALAILADPDHPWHEEVRDYRRSLAVLANQKLLRQCRSGVAPQVTDPSYDTTWVVPAILAGCVVTFSLVVAGMYLFQ